jgi:tetratricopeptide (TPR) repeat protein
VDELPVEIAPVEAAEVSGELLEGKAAAEEAPVVEAPPASEPVAEEVPEIEVIEPTPEAAAIPVAGEPQAAETEEVDLSAEWASLMEETREPEAVAQVPEAAAPDRARPASPAESSAEEFPLPELVVEEAEARAQVVPTAHEETAAAFEIPAESADFEEWSTPQADGSAEPGIHASELLPDEELTTLPVPEHSEVAAEGPETALELPQAALPQTPVPEPEFELDQDFELVLEPEPLVPAHEMLSAIPPSPAASDAPAADKPAAPVAAKANIFSSEEFLSDLGKEIDGLGLNSGGPVSTDPPMHEQLAMQSAEQQRLAKANGPINTEAGPLKEVFDEFRAELGEMGAEDEDLETHYNLGIAFREMGLLEEAIGEFQKVAKANDRGKAFRYAMQCCTLLGLAFMEKGQPAIAAIWYERALLTPGIDSESKLALRYDLGVAQESAGDLDAALKSFSQVYAVNIDYRDVADRIAAHHKPAV